jgi:hypothetical protein
MRINIYAEEISSDVEVIKKVTDDGEFTGLRMYMYLPVTLPDGTQAQGKFMHHPDDDDSSAITFWGKKDLRSLLIKSIEELDTYYDQVEAASSRKVCSCAHGLEDIISVNIDCPLHGTNS